MSFSLVQTQKPVLNIKNIDKICSFLSLFSCSKCGFTPGGKKKVPTSFPKIDKIYIYICFGIYFFF